ncbi:MAG: DNA polymerase III subunit alpha [Dehalococcoidia bacterium]|nr:DNA polymerase III subunit alpha [Dehalococcoidia bacterium]
MTTGYVELHCHSAYSFQEGASWPHELLLRAKELGYPALALTDHDNLAIALDFAHSAKSMGIRPITGAEVTLQGGHHLTLLAETAKGYANLCKLLSYAHVKGDRRAPAIDPDWFGEHGEGLIVLTGCAHGLVPSLAAQGRMRQAAATLRQYLDWFGSGSVFVELSQNLAEQDRSRNRRLHGLARELGVPIVATNNVHYHVPERHRLHDALVAVKSLKSLSESHRERRANNEFYLKSAEQMTPLFTGAEDALANTLRIAERCTFDLTADMGYQFPSYPVPDGYTELSCLRRVCDEAAVRKYGRITRQVQERLDEEFRRMGKHGLAGFFLLYYEIIQLARQVMIDLGHGDAETPLEANPPGRGRGSSVAMLTGYLTGISHIDPLTYDLGLDRFLPEDMGAVPDIDLDFPRDIREELIKRVHHRFGWEHAALVGAITTYQAHGVVRALGKALALPPDLVDRLAKRIDQGDARHLRQEMEGLPEFKHLVDAPDWRAMLELAPQMADLPRGIQQHSGGMVISTRVLTEMVPVMPGAIEGRYVMQWDKDAVDQAGMLKIDFLALGTLSQMQEAVHLIEQRSGKALDLSRINFEDESVYDMLADSDTIGVFQVESAAQMQTLPRLRPRNLMDMAYEVACVRPGVGAIDGVTHFIHRRNETELVTYDHPLEKPALERTLGVILYQDQVMEVAIHVAGFTAREGDQMRRAFAKKNNEGLIRHWWERFRDQAAARGVTEETARKIFGKFNGGYQFPEAHAVAFGVTAFQMAWLKKYHPLEFFVGLLNAQPMGFWGEDVIRGDGGRRGIGLLHPHVNRSEAKAIIEGDAIRLGLLSVKNIGEETAKIILGERQHGGPYASLAGLMARTKLRREELDSLAAAGALDCFGGDRRAVLWEIGLRYRPLGGQGALSLPSEQDTATLPQQTRWERMSDEYRMMGVTPDGHLMEELREELGPRFTTSSQLSALDEGAFVLVAGMVVRLQHPAANAFFVTLDDGEGLIPLILWPAVYEQYRGKLRETFVLVAGRVSRKEGTVNIIVEHVGTLADFRAKQRTRTEGPGTERFQQARPYFR